MKTSFNVCNCCKSEDNYKLNEFQILDKNKIKVVLLCDKCFKRVDNSYLNYFKLKEENTMIKVLFGKKALQDLGKDIEELCY
ncbi:hypothetical protein [Clostridium perfringens]|uniref:hypothetical protein n=1 Tax=Clostridium perfringens TaxID=1502 RepID=UPI00096AC197|nr:hypothetical protein [Clostridium perfringens]